MRGIIVIVLSCFIISACAPAEETAISFYYWKTIFQLTEDEKEVLRSNGVAKLYVRYFDVMLKDGKPVPLASITFNESPGAISIVPVIYIRNEVMLQSKLSTQDLAERVMNYIDQINNKHAIKSNEIQIDCDWTLKSRETYFRFIQDLKKLTRNPLSVTIRLHQIKYYRTTGVPDVTRGVLMYYNMGEIGPDGSNSIYDSKVAKRYVESLKGYPLALDIALPVFSWGIHIRNNKVIGLLNKVDRATFEHDDRFEMKASPFFEVNDDVIKLGHYFKKGDRVKIESVSPEDLEDMAGDLSDQIGRKPAGVIFYDLDNFNLRHYSHDKDLFKKISTAF